jgi:5'-nucleotidase (lipoprotein e(P4) family)
MGKWLLVAIACAIIPSVATAQSPASKERLDVKYVRDSEEYWTLVQQVYQGAREAVLRAKAALPRNVTWGVVLDVDETTLDNSVYELDRESYNATFDSGSWNGWVRRQEAPLVPGAREFIAAVRNAGGRIAFITNRDESVREATRRNLSAVGVWQDGDRLCLQTDDQAYTKAARRGELRKGSGRCSWDGQAMTLVAYVGDQMGDFPLSGEEAASTGGTGNFGVKYFLLPQPMYGSWTSRVTRPAPH